MTVAGIAQHHCCSHRAVRRGRRFSGAGAGRALAERLASHESEFSAESGVQVHGVRNFLSGCMAFNPTLLVATGLHRGRNRRSPDEDELQFKQYLNNDFSPNSVQQRMDIVDNHITFLRDSGYPGLPLSQIRNNLSQSPFFRQMSQIMVLGRMCRRFKGRNVN